MSSIIPGFEYDIFISYRQKDNKGDRWVSEFVEALKTELESTFKEEISVYFDINPHDGLLETHSVDKSLGGKLKCLIFIPIISQTYCDSKCFAWQHEFCAFNKLAKKDQFGRDIKLTSGNVASRILPIKIHDLDPDDKTLLENELGGVLRCIEFIYKEAGVNRPLKPNDDAKENLNKTHYVNQVNKVANAVKEIITAIKKHNQQFEEVSKEVVNAKPEKPKDLKTKLIITSVIILALIVLGYFFIPKLAESSKPVDKSIAILPFRNDSPNDSTTYFINGIMEEILNNLQKIKDIRVISRTSAEQYRNQNKSISEIAKELGVNYIVEGSGQKYGNAFRLRVQLIMAAKESHLWGESYEQEISEPKDIFKIQSQIAQSIATQLEAEITPQEKQLIDKIPTKNLSAYDAYLKGHFFYEKDDNTFNGKAVSWFKESIRLDSTFDMPWTYLSMCYWRNASTSNMPSFKKAKQLAERALELNPNSAAALVNMAEILDNEYDFSGAEEKIKLALKIEPNNLYILRNAGRYYTKLGKADESILFCKQALKNDPYNPTALTYLSLAYFYSGDFTDAWKTLNKFSELGYKGIAWLYYDLLLEEGNIDGILKVPSYEENDYARNFSLIAVHLKLGHETEAKKIIATLIQGGITDNYRFARAYAYVDDPLQVFKWLDKSYAAKERELTYLGVDPAFKKYRNDQRVKKLLQKITSPVKEVSSVIYSDTLTIQVIPKNKFDGVYTVRGIFRDYINPEWEGFYPKIVHLITTSTSTVSKYDAEYSTYNYLFDYGDGSIQHYGNWTLYFVFDASDNVIDVVNSTIDTVPRLRTAILYRGSGAINKFNASDHSIDISYQMKQMNVTPNLRNLIIEHYEYIGPSPNK
jgi:TolB-like protein